jgi:hypothetical protein
MEILSKFDPERVTVPDLFEVVVANPQLFGRLD